MSKPTRVCIKCGKTMDEATQFYTHWDGSKTNMCKKCLTMHVDNWDPNTFLWLLQEMDVPYVATEWNIIRDKQYKEKGKDKMNGMSVFGKYLSKMKLKQWKDYRWADTEKLKTMTEEKERQQRAEREKFEEEIQAQYDNGEISEAQYKTFMSTESQYEKEMENMTWGVAPTGADNPFQEDTFIAEEDLIDTAADLTQEDKVYLAMRWGRLYKPAEWVELEKKYKEMEQSFDIQDADTINTLILICKTDLKMNQAIDCGDVEGFQKLSKVSESLRKSAKFTAAQNKEQKNDYVDSVGELVAMCERQGFIPRFATDIPQDKVDLTLKDMNTYVEKLVKQDLGFGQQIEDALKKIQIQQQMNEAEEAEALLENDEPEGLKDADYVEFYNSIEEQRALDELQGDE